ncbi:hypothetical protein ABPG74_011180 [Tetrahymena malaccensis]
MVSQQSVLQGVIVAISLCLAGIAIFSQQSEKSSSVAVEGIQNSYQTGRSLYGLDDEYNSKEFESGYSKLFQYHFKGNWQAIQPTDNQISGQLENRSINLDEQLGFIRKSNGKIYVRFNDLMFSENKMLYIYLYEDEFYDDQRRILIKMPFEVNRLYNQYHQNIAMMMMMDKMMQIDRDDLEVTFESFFYNRNSKKIIYQNMGGNNVDFEQINFHISVQAISKGRLLSFTSELELATESQVLKNLNFCLFATAISIISLAGSTLLYNKLRQSENEAKNLSLVTLGFCTVQDAYLCLVFLWQALSMNKLFIMYTIPALCYFMLSTVFEMRLTVLAWKEKYYYRFSQQNEVKKGIAIFYSLFYLGLFGFFISMSFFFIYDSFIFCLSFFFVPQIICSAINGNSKKFYNSYVFGILLPRIALPLYMRGCPSNIMNFKPSQEFCVLWVTSFAFQIFIMYLQSKFGPRFFIPSIFLPKQYNYNFVYQYNPEEKDTDDCSICLGPLHLNPMEDEPPKDNKKCQINLDQKPSYNTQLIKKKKIYKTPCNHMFHIECLHQWIEVKLECPQCRQSLPTCF